MRATTTTAPAAAPPLSRCPRCGAPVIATPGGRLLDPTPDPLAVIGPDGRPLPADIVVDAALGRRPPAGHHPHAPGPYGCNPKQLALDL